MSKNDSKKKVAVAVDNQRNRQTAQSDQMYSEMHPAYVNSRDDDQRTRAELEERFRNFTPGYDPNAYLGGAGGTAVYGGGGGGGGGSALKPGGINLGKIVGGIDQGIIDRMGADPYAGYQQMSQGLRPEFWADFNKYMGNFDTANQNLAGAATSYRNFIDTGGFSEADLGNIRARANAPSRAIYQQGQDQIDTAMARSGMNPLAGEVYRRKLAREGNEQIGNISRATEADIAERVQSGKLAGTAGLAATGLSQAQVAEMQAQARTQVEQLDQQMRAQGLAGMTDIEKSRLEATLTNQQITQAGQIATNQGILSKAQIEAQKAASRASSGAASAALAQRQREFDAQQRFQVQQATNRDLLSNQNLWTNMYGTVPGATSMTGSQLLQLQNNSAGQGINLIGQEIAGSQIPSGFQSGLGSFGNIANLIGTGANAYNAARGGGTGGGQGYNDPYNPYEYETSGLPGGYQSDENGNSYYNYDPYANDGRGSYYDDRFPQ